MIEVETLQTENRVISQILHTLADEGFVTIINEDDEEMGETTLHYNLCSYLYTALTLFLGERDDCLVAANLNLYYDDESPRKWYAPDCFVAFGVEKGERASYQLSVEGVMPQVIFEIASEQTSDVDLGKKYRDYALLGVEEYYLLDPARDNLPMPLIAYQKQDDYLLQTRLTNNRVFSPRLGLEIVDTGDSFRLFNPATSEFLSTPEELAQKTQQLAEERDALRRRIAELEALLKEKQND